MLKFLRKFVSLVLSILKKNTISSPCFISFFLILHFLFSTIENILTCRIVVTKEFLIFLQKTEGKNTNLP